MYLDATLINFQNYNLREADRHLFMRVGGGPAGLTYEIAPGHPVHYVGMTADGSKVYFTSAEKLTPEAEDSSTNLYMWSEQGELEGDPLTLISKPSGSSGTGTPVCPTDYLDQRMWSGAYRKCAFEVPQRLHPQRRSRWEWPLR